MRSLRALRRRLAGEGGFQLLEVAVATGLMGIAVIGLVGAMALGAHTVGLSKQRSGAATVASERIENIRDLPFEQVALDVEPAHDPDPDHPNHYVTTEDPPRLDVHRDGSTLEGFVVGGTVKHEEDPVMRGTTEMFVHQYVTWVDEPDVKRATVVVTWRSTMNPAVRSDVITSTLVSRGSVVVPEVTPPPPSPEPEGEPEGAPAPEGSECSDGDPAPEGSMRILSGAGAESGYTNSTSVHVSFEADEGCGPPRAELANHTDGPFVDVGAFEWNADAEAWETLTVTWTLPAGDGEKWVYGRIVDPEGRESDIYEDDIVLDQTAPTTPDNFAQTSCSESGSDRTVTLTWGASQDQNLSGYRLYRSINSAPWEVVATTSQHSASDTARRTHESVRYLVRAYDKAGNESGDSEVLTYARNECSPT